MKAARLILMGCAALALAGCDQAFQSSYERNLSQAEKKAAQQDYPAAVLLYEGAIDGTPQTAETHYKLALIYDDHIKQPASAIHHFQRYLEIAPQGAHTKEAQKYLKEDQLRLLADAGSGASVSQEEAKRLKNKNLELQSKILELKEEVEAANKARIAAYKAAGGKNGPLKQEQVQKPLVPGVRTYTVGPRDTLASISRKFYNNNSAKWKKIQDANFNALDGTAKIKPGMVLMIP